MRRPLPRSPVAQLAEHPAVNRRVVGSSPTRGASQVLEIGTNWKGRPPMTPLSVPEFVPLSILVFGDPYAGRTVRFGQSKTE
jgi:hypothetical protein